MQINLRLIISRQQIEIKSEKCSYLHCLIWHLDLWLILCSERQKWIDLFNRIKFNLNFINVYTYVHQKTYYCLIDILRRVETRNIYG